jgi:aryl-alcohol dehydrogenase-like predicted oxidoreductase
LKRTNRIGLGTVQFGLDYGISNQGGQPNEMDVSQILDFATESGISYLDTANAYGDSEKRLGDYDVSKFNIVSKFMPENVSGTIENQFHNSLLLLKVEKIYGYLSHRSSELLKNPGIWQKLIRLRDENKIHKIGFSVDQPSELIRLMEKNMTPDLVQLPYNYFDRRFESFFSVLKEQKVEIHTRSTFLQGLFFLKNIPAPFQAVADTIEELQKTISDLPSALTQFVLNNDNVDVALIGVQKAEQLHQIISGLSKPIVLPEFNQLISEDILMPSRWKTT